MLNAQRLVPLALLCGVCAAAIVAGCSSGPSDSLDAPAANAPGVSDGGAEGGPAPSPSTDDEPVAPYLRRLTTQEYTNTVTDLFPGTTLSFESLLADSREKGKFDNDVAEQGATQTTIASFENAAEDIAAALVKSPGGDPQLATCLAMSGAAADGCAHTYFDAMLPRVYRRPLATDERSRVDAFYTQQKAAYDFPTAVRMTIAAVLLTPQFLFRAEMVKAGENVASRVTLTPYELASRLSYFLWQSMPDAALFQSAANGKLASADDVERETRRMLKTQRARLAARDFHMQWLDLDHVDTIVKDAKEYPAVTDALKTSMREESERFSEWNMFDGPGTLQSFLTTPQTFVDKNTAPLYGVAAPAQMTLTPLDPQQRAGILTQASIQSVLAHDQIGSPILRGVFVMDRFLCEYLDAPADIPPAPTPDPDAGASSPTERELFTNLTSASGCTGCHSQINPIGFSFLHYDALGQWRDTDHGLPIDATGQAGGVGSFNGAVELAKELSVSDDVRQCVTRKWFRYAFGRQEGMGDEGSLAVINQGFGASGYKLQELLVSIVRTQAFRSRLGQKL